MPATRSSTRAESRQPLANHPTNARASTPEIIVLSSDEDELPKTPVPKKKRQQARLRLRQIPLTAEIVEISSDDDEPRASSARVHSFTSSRRCSPRCSPRRSPSVSTATVLQQLKEAREQITKLEGELHARDHELRAREQQDRTSRNLLSAIDEHVNCEICTLKQWTPAALTCGHTFCQTCLQDWFTSTLTQHMAAHPQYNEQHAILQQYRTALQNPNLTPQGRRQIEASIATIYNHHPQPQYTCPSCRAPVKSKPTEVFALKHIVHTVATAMGEHSPKKAAPARTARGGAARRAALDDPWDGFFSSTV